jgi:hypothetical protein
MCVEPTFDHEKLDVYGLELQFVAWTTDFLTEASQSPVSHRREHEGAYFAKAFS